MLRKLIKKIVEMLFCIFPMKNIVLFESNSDYSDSSKAIFEEMIRHNLQEKYKMIWFVEHVDNFKNSKQVEYKQVEPKNLKEFVIKYYYCSVAKYCFYTHRLLGNQYRKNQIRYYLTHSPLPIKNSKGYVLNYKVNTYIEVISEFAAKYRCKTLGGGMDRIKALGLPRNDFLFKMDDECLDKLKINNYSKLFIWMPTFKHCVSNKTRNDYSVEKDNDITLLNEENLISLNEILEECNAYLIIKFHPAQDMNFIKEYKLSNIIFLTNKQLADMNIELYTLLVYTDALITDFSSIYVDYLLLNKPIAFELTDKKDYENGIGFTMDNPLEFMPGFKVHNFNDLKIFFNEVINNEDGFKKERESLLNKLHKFKDGKSSERILRELNFLK